MSAAYLIDTMPVTLHNSEPMEQLGYKKLGEAFQNSLYKGQKFKDILKDKICKCCQLPKKAQEYSINKSMRDGRLNQCKECIEEGRLERAAQAREDYKSITREGMDKRNETGRKTYRNKRA